VIYSDKEVFQKFDDDDLESVEQHFIQSHANIELLVDGGRYEDLDEIMNLKKVCEVSFDFLRDLKKIKRIIEKKDFETNYPELIELFGELAQEEINEDTEKILKPEHKRISNKLKKNITVRAVLKEFLSSPHRPEIEIEMVEIMLGRFNLEYDEEKIQSLMEELREEVELEDFEKDLGDTSKNFSLQDPSELNGHQFESFLAKLFESLGYIVVQTKLTGDQGADLIVMKDGAKTVVQAKKYSGNVSNKAIQEVVAAKKHYNCENTMVVTTGEFTKSALQLSMSNNVELWDKNKLQRVIEEINSSGKIYKKSQQSVSLMNDVFPVSCPYCDSAIKFSSDELPVIGDEFQSTCSECSIGLALQIPDKFYSCVGCHKEFDTVSERLHHEKKCEKAQERQFNCIQCKKEFTLDDSEFSEIKKKSTVTVKCPACEAKNLLKIKIVS